MRRFGTAALLAALFAMPGLPAQASTSTTAAVSPGYAQAMARDLGLTTAQVAQRLSAEARAAAKEQTLRKSLGDSFGGAWFDEAKGTLVVGVTDAALTGRVKAAGATPKLVKHSAARLEEMRRSLDRAPRPAAGDVSSWYADPSTGTITVSVRPGAEAVARDFLAAAGIDASAARIVLEQQAVTSIDSFPVAPDAIYGGGKLDLLTTGGFCSSGFAVQRTVAPFYGMITAGHCGISGYRANFQVGAGSTTDIGTFAGSVFPGSGDYAFVTHDNYQFEGTPFVVQQVLDYTGRAIPVDGLQEAPINASVCRSGTSSGWRCGRITARNVTVNYVEGTTFGLTRSTAQAVPGDSGGPFLAGTQAQGTLSGTGGGSTFYQPVRPVLQAFGLSLMTRFGPMPG